MVEAGATIHLGRVTARLAGGTAQAAGAAQLRATHLLDRADLVPSGIPPSAMLFVRRLGDPLPGRVNLGRAAPTAAPDWEQATRTALADCFARAARPARETVPTDAAAVRFDDEGELLACLARDLVRGRAASWWWRTVTRSLPLTPGGALATLFKRRATLVPAALHHLDTWGEAATVVTSLTADQAMVVVAELSRVYALPTFTHAAGSSAPPDRRSREQSEPLHSHPRGEVWWYPWFTADDVPAPQHRLLLGVGLGLHRAPGFVRGPAFQRELRRWWAVETAATDPPRPALAKVEPAPSSHHAVSTGRDRLDAPPVDSPVRDRQADSWVYGTQLRVAVTPPAPPPEPMPVVAPPEPDTTQDRAGPRPRAPEPESYPESGPSPWGCDGVRAHRMADPTAVTAPSPMMGSAPHLSASNDPEEPAAPRRRRTTDRAEPGAPAWVMTWPEDGIGTDLGGVLFLIAAMCTLDVPDAFEDSLGLASEAGAWGTLDLLGRALLAPFARPADIADPLWPVLASLAGRRAKSSPRLAERTGTAFQVPLAWPAAVGDDDAGAFAWGAAGGRVRLWSEQSGGYLLVDRPLDPASTGKEAVFSALSGYGLEAGCRHRAFASAPLASVRGPLVRGLSRDLIFWLRRVVPFVRLRLHRALGSPADGVDPVAHLFRRRARLYVTSTHVDLAMSLDEVSLPARLAGLDRDPGWLPEFGRVIKFHYEA